MLRLTMLTGLFAAGALLAGTACSAQETKTADGYVSLFDGKTLSGWEYLPLPGQEGKTKWEVKDGALCGSGGASMLYSPKTYKNFKVRAEININDKGNSGFYFRSAKVPGFTGGYEAQVDSTHTDPIRTGSIYGMVHVYEQYQKPGEWFTYELEVVDKPWRGKTATAIKVAINGKTLYEYFDFDQTHKQGHFAFQQHDPGSKVMIRKIEVQELP
jgi:hypothetical protein